MLLARMGKPGSKNPRPCRASTAASASGELPPPPTWLYGMVPSARSEARPPIWPCPTLALTLYPLLGTDSLHCFCILGVWSMSRGTKGRTPKRSPLLVVGLAVGKRSDDGEYLSLSTLPTTPPPVFRYFALLPKSQVHAAHTISFSIDTICSRLPHTPHHPACLIPSFSPNPTQPNQTPRPCSTSSLVFLILSCNIANIPST